MVGSGPNQAESMGSQHQDHFCNLEQRRDREESVHTTNTSRSQSRGGTTSLMKKMLETCSKRLITCGGSYAANDRGELLQVLFLLLVEKKMAATSPDRRLPLVSLSHAMRITTVGIGVKAHPIKAWETTLLVGR